MDPIEEINSAMKELELAYMTLDPDSQAANHIGKAVMSLSGAKFIVMLNPIVTSRDNVLQALEALGALPDGYCFCHRNRDAHKPEHEHTGECREARAAIERRRSKQ